MTTGGLARIQDDDLSQWVTFALDGEYYGIDVEQVQDVMRVPIAPLPERPGQVTGLGPPEDPLTMIDARRLLGCTQKEPDGATRILVVELSEGMIGMIVDSMAEVVDIREGSIEPFPLGESGYRARHICGTYHHDCHIITLLDLETLVAEHIQSGLN